MPRIVAIEEINGRLMVEIEKPSGDGMCSILSKEEVEVNDATIAHALHVLEFADKLAEAAMKVAYGNGSLKELISALEAYDDQRN